MKNNIKVINVVLFVCSTLLTLFLYISCGGGVIGGALSSEDPGDPQDLTAAPPTCEPGYTEIKTRADLEAIGTDANSLAMNYCLVADIDLSGADFEPIGSTTTPFLGKFDGNNLKIIGLTINKPGENNVGLFSQIGASGNTAPEVKNLVIEGADVTGATTTATFAGIVYGTIKNVSVVSSNIKADGDETEYGGLIGSLAGGLVEDSHTDVNITVVTGTRGASIGTFIGAISNATVRRSSSRGNATKTLSATGDNPASFVGRLDDNGTIEDSYTLATLDLFYNNAFVYISSSSSMIKNCYAAGSVTVIPNSSGNFLSSGFGGDPGITIENSYFGIAETGHTNAYYGRPLSNPAIGVSSGANIMQSGTGFVDSGNSNNPIFVGWDFTNVWEWTSGWPTLRKPSTP